MQKLMVSKQIMDRHNDMDRGVAPKQTSPQSLVREFDETPIPSTYNIPQEFLTSAPQVPKVSSVVTEDRIMNSKLPDAIKRLMMEHPINQPQQYQATISDDIIEKASRLMGNKKETVVENKKTNQIYSPNGLTADDIKKIVRETVEEVLSENGLMVESSQKSNEIMTIKVGKHIFEGKISKVKKVQ